MATIDKDINEALLLDILEVYSGAENKLLNAVAKRVAKGIKEEGWTEKKLESVKKLQEEIEKILDSTSKMSKSKISQGIIDAYKKGYAEVGGPKGVHKTVLDELDIPMNLKMQVLATNNLLDNASFQVLRHANDAYQQVMAQATTGLLAGVDTRIQASQKMLNAFAMKGITSFVDKAGRSWDLSSYAEMCARTVSAHAALQGHIDRQVEVGEDLVKVSTIGTTCPICQRWQNVVLSISGNHPKYHSLEEAKASGLFHPNCKHTLVMHIPDLDGEGKVEPSLYNGATQSSQQYYEIQQQRANERKIRYWKKRQAVAITPEEQKKASDKIKYWQHTNLLHCEKYGLRRQYAREGVMQGKIGGPIGPIGYGGSLKEYTELYKDVVGEDPKKVYKKLKMNLQLFAEKEFKKWLKEEIQSLDQLDIDKAQMKDANNKAVTPTSLYKKYIGDNPMQDWADVSPYEKGTKEYKSGYAKWLKKQIEEIGVSYKIKPKYVEVHEDIPDEDKSLSATNIYKKYYNEAPTEAFKKLGGEAGTGMKYGKWVETQKKELIKNGITKTVPFANATTQKTVNVISQAKAGIDNAKVFDYLTMLQNEVHGNYDGYLKVKEQLEVFKQDMSNALESKKLDLAKEKHLEMVEKKALKEYGTASYNASWNKLVDMKIKETDPIMKAHIQSQLDTYTKVCKQKHDEEEAKKKAAEEAKKKAEEAAVKAKAAQALKSGKVSLGRETKFNEGQLVERDRIYQNLDLSDLEKLSDQVAGHKFFKNSNRRDILGRDRVTAKNHHLGHDVRVKDGLTGADKELAEAFAFAYDEYFNTIQCQPINVAYLKGYENASPSMKKKIDMMNRAIQSVELNEPILLHRYIDRDIVEAIFKTSDVHNIEKGDLFDNNTFMSASTGGHPTFGKRNYKLTLQVDKGTHALPTLNHEELEVLLGKGKLEFVRANTYSKSSPQKLRNFDGSWTEFVGDEIVVRYIEDGKAQEYEKVTPESIDKMLKAETNVKTHVTTESKEWLAAITSSEKSSTVKYTGSYYTEINNVYRQNDASDKTIIRNAHDMTSAFRKASITKPVVLRRGIHEKDLAFMLGFNGDFSKVLLNWDKINEGGFAAEDKGFLSTSPYGSGGFTSKDVDLRIYCPTGTHAAYVAPISHYQSERETILQSGSMYRVLKLEKAGGKTVAYVELLGTD